MHLNTLVGSKERKRAKDMMMLGTVLMDFEIISHNSDFGLTNSSMYVLCFYCFLYRNILG